ncbi:MAG: Gfo/Idh/MocA family oxidoreductase [Alphaproteobacteria bacterium]|nr:Gfo/Idh/MocA family oxidoreductase [Alphaproteobacteria bacterium]
MSAEAGAPPLGLGILGLGGAAVNMLPSFLRSPYVDLVAVADADSTVLERFAADFPDVRTHGDVAGLAGDEAVDLVYIGTPNHLHFTHAQAMLNGGKHVLIEKPMAVTLDDAEEMILTAERNGVLLGVNVKHSFEPRIQAIRALAVSGELGRLRMIHSWRFVDWLYRPRTAEEITPGWGNGILWRQGPHQFDIIRTIGGGLMRSVRGTTGIWDPARRVPGSFTVYFEFHDGVSGTAVCSSYDHFDSRALVYGFDGAAPLGDEKRHARARRELAGHADEPEWEDRAASAERYGGGRRSTQVSQSVGQSGGWILGGPLIASFDHGDVRLSPGGLVVDGDESQREITFPDAGDGRDARLKTFYKAVAEGRPLPADGRWGKATQEVLVAIERSAETRTEIMLEHQTAYPDEVVPAL